MKIFVPAQAPISPCPRNISDHSQPLTALFQFFILFYFSFSPIKQKGFHWFFTAVGPLILIRSALLSRSSSPWKRLKFRINVFICVDLWHVLTDRAYTGISDRIRSRSTVLHYWNDGGLKPLIAGSRTSKEAFQEIDCVESLIGGFDWRWTGVCREGGVGVEMGCEIFSVQPHMSDSGGREHI